MYTAVVMAAMLTSTANQPAWGRMGCHGCHGCYGSYYSCHGCHVYSCSGCYGCNGFQGNGYGGYGFTGYASGFLGGSSWDYAWWNSNGLYGWAGPYRTFSYHPSTGANPFGCLGYQMTYGHPAMGAVAPVPIPILGAAPEQAPMPEKKDKMKGSTGVSNRATIVVQLPADAKLYVGDRLSSQNSEVRTVVSPELEADTDYVYTLKAEAVRDGKPVVQTKQVAFRAGANVRVDFDLTESRAASVESAPARITVLLPEDARLFVDGALTPLTSSTRSLDTPKLQAGVTYYYSIKAEVNRNGRTHSEDRTVLVEAGKPVTVDFGTMTSPVTARR